MQMCVYVFISTHTHRHCTVFVLQVSHNFRKTQSLNRLLHNWLFLITLLPHATCYNIITTCHLLPTLVVFHNYSLLKRTQFHYYYYYYYYYYSVLHYFVDI